MKPDIRAVIYNPFDPACAVFTPELFERVRAFARDVARIALFDAVARSIMARSAAGDPNLMVVMVIEGKKIVAHCICEIFNVDGLKICFVGQTQADKPGLIDNQLWIVDNWARSNECQIMRTESSADVFSSKSASRLWRRLGYKLVGYSLEREIGSGTKGLTDGQKQEI